MGFSLSERDTAGRGHLRRDVSDSLHGSVYASGAMHSVLSPSVSRADCANARARDDPRKSLKRQSGYEIRSELHGVSLHALSFHRNPFLRQNHVESSRSP